MYHLLLFLFWRRVSSGLDGGEEAETNIFRLRYTKRRREEKRMAMMTMTTKLGVPFSKAFQSPNQDSTPKKKSRRREREG